MFLAKEENAEKTYAELKEEYLILEAFFQHPALISQNLT